jgi:hypothetical protein
VSADGEGENSPYTQALAKAMQEPGLAAEEAFRQVRVRVLEATYGNQVPWESSSLTGAFYFSTPPAGGSVGTSGPQTGASAIVEARLTEQAPLAPPPPVSIPTTPPAVSRGNISGRWEGKYQCQDQDIGFSLNITNDGDNRIAAIFEFFPLPGTLSFPRGSFRMAGHYDRADGRIHMQSTGRLKRPLGFQSHDMEGQLEANGAVINGRILTTGCAHFVLTRR